MSRLDDILKPIFTQWLSDEEGLISEMSIDIANDTEEAKLKNAELFEHVKHQIKASLTQYVEAHKESVTLNDGALVDCLDYYDFIEWVSSL